MRDACSFFQVKSSQVKSSLYINNRQPMTEAYRMCSGSQQGGTGVGGDDGGGGGGGGGRPGGAEAVAGRGGGLGGLHLRLARLPPLPPFPTTSHTHCINKISHCHVAVGRREANSLCFLVKRLSICVTYSCPPGTPFASLSARSHDDARAEKTRRTYDFRLAS